MVEVAPDARLPHLMPGDACSSCGAVAPRRALSIRSWTCDACGVTHDRDANASQNILAAGARGQDRVSSPATACGGDVRRVGFGPACRPDEAGTRIVRCTETAVHREKPPPSGGGGVNAWTRSNRSTLRGLRCAKLPCSSSVSPFLRGCTTP
ncbi:hypothetical protein QO001_006475 [Methylobacterium brachiatum]|uniref:Cas12f1-like TNB domain-containing protein n=2 Tax=Methylobacterium brachiatum TaxID=269660 RepID=A0AAJ1TUM6_9HYPH|nr:hypothetical protein [Methylobacterium brachiatum]